METHEQIFDIKLEKACMFASGEKKLMNLGLITFLRIFKGFFWGWSKGTFEPSSLLMQVETEHTS